jgi:uncharacterized protein with ParB-like and HNH nuclease domain
MPTTSKAEPTKLQSQLDENRQRVDVDHYDITISELVRMAADDELLIAPVYQRHFRWKTEDESRLIESLFLGLPVPSIYVATNPDATWEVVDGLQRLSTIMHFIAEPEEILAQTGKKEPLVLEGLEELSQFNNSSFQDLPGPIRLAFTRRPLRVTALSDKSDYQARFDLFERLNRGGVILSPQEVRASIFQGPFNDLLRELAEDKNLQSLLKLQRGAQHDGTREEQVLKFFAYMNDRARFKGAVTKFLNDYMAKARKNIDIEASRELFLKATSALSEIMGGKPFLRSKVTNTPLNQFEAVIVAAGELLAAGKIPKDPGKKWTNDPELVRSSTRGTNTAAMLRARIQRATELLSGTA